MNYLARLLAMPEPSARLPDAGRAQGAESVGSLDAPSFDTFDTSPLGRVLEDGPDKYGHSGASEGLAHLATKAPPPGIQFRRWEQVQADALALGGTWAGAALALGWREVDLWGCDPTRPRGGWTATGWRCC